MDGRSASVARGCPPAVAEALANAERRSFGYSCEDPVGPLLATLAAAVPAGGSILELGTGAGVGTAWLVSGVGDRTDVAVRTVEVDPALASVVRGYAWPTWVEVLTGDVGALLPRLGGQDLIFADAPAGKWTGLEHTIAALRPGGVLVVDDMDPARYAEAEHRTTIAAVRAALVGDDRLVVAELPVGSGIMLATRRAD